MILRGAQGVTYFLQGLPGFFVLFAFPQQNLCCRIFNNTKLPVLFSQRTSKGMTEDRVKRIIWGHLVRWHQWVRERLLTQRAWSTTIYKWPLSTQCWLVIRGITNTVLLFKGSHVPGSMLVRRASAITESFSGYNPAQWIFVSTKITATGNAFRVMDLFSLPAPTTSPYTHLRPPKPMCISFSPHRRTGQRHVLWPMSWWQE